MLLTFLPSCRAVGLFDQIVTASGRHDLDVLHRVEHGKLTQGCPIAPQLVGMDNLRHVVFPQQSLEERSGGLGVAVFLKENFQHGSVFVHGPPQPLFDTPHVHAHLVKVPPGTPTGFPVAEILSKEISEFEAPSADGLVGDGDASFQQKFLDVPVTEGEPVVEPHGVADNRRGEPVTGELLTAEHCVTLPQQLATTGQRIDENERRE
ncbi:hypothetical protein DAETH_35800 (plasmid) [Deinococcus aetherius]|uniref:Uncharacterized protein n=1 Tax=Deinococcus aetherius TaxID=200252 RepID=A0ABN6RMQ3_9DEIO|nr:hypothetical protein DAETH_35800 [Deinococcus aetherius]